MWDQRLRPIRIRDTALRCFLQDPGQVAEAEQDCAALRAIRGIGKQEVLAGDYKGLNAALGPVIAELNAAVI